MIDLELIIIYKVMEHGEFFKDKKWLLKLINMLWKYLKLIYNLNGWYMLLELVGFRKRIQDQRINNFIFKIIDWIHFYCINIEILWALNQINKDMIIKINNIYIQELELLKDWNLNNFGKVKKNFNLELIIQFMLRNSNSNNGC